MADVHVVVGGQFGSEGKGHFTAQLAKEVAQEAMPLVIRTGGPNAGHTVIDPSGREWKLRQIPVAAVMLPDAPVAIAAGAEIDDEVLKQEIYLMEVEGIPVLHRLFVDQSATIIEQHHKTIEQEHGIGGKSLTERIGSTGKGIGAARAARMMREADLYGGGVDVIDVAQNHLDNGLPVIIEGTQGYGLGLHAGYYPKCTSRDVRAIDLLAEVGISPWGPNVDRVIVWVVFRPFPIRVAGDSGPLHRETTWDELGLDPEFTTVTQKMRRVGKWDPLLAENAMIANGHNPSDGGRDDVRPVLMFADQVDYELEGVEKIGDFRDDNWSYIADFERSIRTTFWGFGTGPSTFAWRYNINEE